MLPDDANPQGNVHGGTIMKLVDTAAGVAAMRHCRTRVVTARIDAMNFVAPVRIGDVVILKASVNQVYRTSMEIGVRVEAEDLMTGDIRHVASAYLVFVSIDAHGRAVVAPALTAETTDEHRRMAAAQQRHDQRAAQQG